MAYCVTSPRGSPLLRASRFTKCLSPRPRSVRVQWTESTEAKLEASIAGAVRESGDDGAETQGELASDPDTAQANGSSAAGVRPACPCGECEANYHGVGL